MTESKGQLHVVLPGLLGPIPNPDQNVPDLPALSRLLSRADKSGNQGADPESTLFPLFGVQRSSTGDWPSAAVCQYGCGGEAGEGWWLHADPVLLRPDMERLLLFPAEALGIEQAEAQSLIELLDGHFRDDGWRLRAMASDRWLLRLAEAPSIVTRALHEVAGRSMFPFLPDGKDALRWHGLLNEAQMLLFNAPVNQARRAQGRLEINGLWLWGGGRLPTTSADHWRQVVSDHPLARGLGRLAGAEVRGLDEELPQGQGGLLLYRDELFAPVLMGDPMEWERRLQTLAPWFGGLLEGVRQGRWRRLLLYPCNGHSYAVNAAGLRRFWRRPRPLQHFFGELPG